MRNSRRLLCARIRRWNIAIRRCILSMRRGWQHQRQRQQACVVNIIRSRLVYSLRWPSDKAGGRCECCCCWQLVHHITPDVRHAPARVMEDYQCAGGDDGLMRGRVHDLRTLITRRRSSVCALVKVLPRLPSTSRSVPCGVRCSARRPVAVAGGLVDTVPLTNYSCLAFRPHHSRP